MVKLVLALILIAAASGGHFFSIKAPENLAFKENYEKPAKYPRMDDNYDHDDNDGDDDEYDYGYDDDINDYDNDNDYDGDDEGNTKNAQKIIETP